MKNSIILLATLFAMFLPAKNATAAVTVYQWQPLELTFSAEDQYDNPYTDVTMWVNLQGPGFNKRIYGFWDGGNTFKVRVVAPSIGDWKWASGTNQPEDKGLSGKTGDFTAVGWSESELRENPNRRGILRATPNGRALQYADGTPFFMVGDTWWAASTWRLPYKGLMPDNDYEPGPGIGFEELVSYRKQQGYNSINIIASFANWDADHLPSQYWNEEGLCIRAGWEKFGHLSDRDGLFTIKDMHDESGNRPFAMLPVEVGVPDYNRLNPDYFKSLDRKIRHLWEQGFIAMLEPVRRDSTPAWDAYFDFNTTYARFVNYLYSRYGTYNLIFSGIHLDAIPEKASLQADDFNEALTYFHETYGPPPFGQPVTTLITRSTYEYFGHGKDCPWLTMHSVGNFPRDNRMTDYLQELWSLEPAYPYVNLEPYYPGWRTAPAGERPPANSERDNYFARAQMYSCVLSGALAGHVFGHAGYDCTTTGEPKGERPYIWEALQYKSGAQMQYLRDFILSEGKRYQDLVLARDDVHPNTAQEFQKDGLDGWAFMMKTRESDLALLYFQNAAQRASLSGFDPEKTYQLDWYDPRSGNWVKSVRVKADSTGKIALPEFPGMLDTAHTDWAAKIKLASQG